eukprot:gene59219-79018_t
MSMTKYSPVRALVMATELRTQPEYRLIVSIPRSETHTQRLGWKAAVVDENIEADVLEILLTKSPFNGSMMFTSPSKAAAQLRQINVAEKALDEKIIAMVNKAKIQ